MHDGIGFFSSSQRHTIAPPLNPNWMNYTGSNDSSWTIISSAVFNAAERNIFAKVGNNIHFVFSSAPSSSSLPLQICSFSVSGDTITGLNNITTISQTGNQFFQSYPQMTQSKTTPQQLLVLGGAGALIEMTASGLSVTKRTTTPVSGLALTNSDTRSSIIQPHENANTFFAIRQGSTNIITVSGTTLEQSTAATNSISNITFVDVKVSAETGAVGMFFYTADGNHNQGVARTITFPGTLGGISFLTSVFSASTMEFLSVDRIQPNKYILKYRNSSRHPLLTAVTVINAASVEYGNNLTVTTDDAVDYCYQTISDEFGMIAYRTTAGAVRLCVIDDRTSTLAAGSPVTVLTGATDVTTTQSRLGLFKYDTDRLVCVTTSPTGNTIARIIRP